MFRKIIGYVVLLSLICTFTFTWPIPQGVATGGTVVGQVYVSGMSSGSTLYATVSSGVPGLPVTCDYSVDGGSTLISALPQGNTPTYCSATIAPTIVDLALVIMKATTSEGTTQSTGGAILDTIAPVVGSLSISPDVSGFTSGSPTISAIITDAGSGVFGCEMSTDSFATPIPATWDSGTNTCSYTVPSVLADGNTYAYNLRAKDNVGVTGTGSSISRINDSLAPVFGSPAVKVLKQDGASPMHDTNLWYYYTGTGSSLRAEMKVTDAKSDIASVKLCTKPIVTGISSDACSPSDFNNPSYYITETSSGSGIWEFNTPLSTITSTLPITPGGYVLNVQAVDNVGNTLYSSGANPNESLVAVFGVNPRTISPLDVVQPSNTTTDWSTITDFTDVPNLTFHAIHSTVDKGELRFLGNVNLTDSATLAGLLNFAGNITVWAEDLRLDSSALVALNQPAQLMMYMFNNSEHPGLIVKSNTGAIIGYVPFTQTGSIVIGSDTLNGFTWDPGLQQFSFTTTGFSEFVGDNIAPSITVDTPINGSVASNTAPTISVTTSEDANCQYKLDSGSYVSMATTGSTTHTQNLSGLSTGSHSLIVQCADLVGNVTTSPTTTWSITSNTGGTGGGGGGTWIYNSNTNSSGSGVNSNTNSSNGNMNSFQLPPDVIGHWSEEYVRKAMMGGYVEGYADGLFRPNNPINRAESAKLIALYKNPNVMTTLCEINPFADVLCSAWYGKYVNYIKSLQIVADVLLYRPSDNLTRAEALKMFIMTKGAQDTDLTGFVNPFKDVSADAWYYRYVMIGSKLKIVKGYLDGTFRPKDLITRAEFVKIFVVTLLP